MFKLLTADDAAVDIPAVDASAAANGNDGVEFVRKAVVDVAAVVAVGGNSK